MKAKVCRCYDRGEHRRWIVTTHRMIAYFATWEEAIQYAVAWYRAQWDF